MPQAYEYACYRVQLPTGSCWQIVLEQAMNEVKVAQAWEALSTEGSEDNTVHQNRTEQWNKEHWKNCFVTEF